MDTRVFGVLAGLVAVYLFYSLSVAQLNELVAAMLALRAKQLEAYLKEKLLGPQLAGSLLQHPAIQSLALTRKNLPSYIPGAVFSKALWAALGGDAAPPTTPAEWARAITNAAIAADEKKRLLAILQAGAQAGQSAELSVARWFDTAMDRLSGAYRRHMQRVSFVIAALLVLATNADTVVMAKRAWNDPIARQAAQAMAVKSPEACTRDDDGVVSCGKELRDELPTQWTRAQLVQLKDWRNLLIKLAGLLFTVMAVSLGAPFWFDLLTKIAPGLRMTGVAPPKTPAADPAAAAPAAAAPAAPAPAAD